jgi:hypothetical protein
VYHLFPRSVVLVKDSFGKLSIAIIVIVNNTHAITANWYRALKPDVVAPYIDPQDPGMSDVNEICQSLTFEEVPVSGIIDLAMVCKPSFIVNGMHDVFGMNSVYLLRYQETVYGGYTNIDVNNECHAFSCNYTALDRDQCPNVLVWYGLSELKTVLRLMIVKCDKKNVGSKGQYADSASFNFTARAFFKRPLISTCGPFVLVKKKHRGYVQTSTKLWVGAVEKKHECLRVDTQLKLSTLRDSL